MADFLDWLKSARMFEDELPQWQREYLDRLEAKMRDRISIPLTLEQAHYYQTSAYFRDAVDGLIRLFIPRYLAGALEIAKVDERTQQAEMRRLMMETPPLFNGELPEEGD